LVVGILLAETNITFLLLNLTSYC